MDNEELAARLQKIEAHLTHLERQYEQLNEVVIAQEKRWSKMQAVQSQLAQTMESIEMERIKATNPKPPHYGP